MTIQTQKQPVEKKQVTIEEKLEVAEASIKMLTSLINSLEKENLHLNELKQIATSLIKNLMGKCSICGKNFIHIDWNAETYILTCDTQGCTKWRQPVFTMKKKDLNLF